MWVVKRNKSSVAKEITEILKNIMQTLMQQFIINFSHVDNETSSIVSYLCLFPKILFKKCFEFGHWSPILLQN